MQNFDRETSWKGTSYQTMVEDNNEIDPRESGCKNVSWIELVQDQVQG